MIDRFLHRLWSAAQVIALLVFGCGLGWIVGSTIRNGVKEMFPNPKAVYASRPAQYWQPLPDSMYVYEDVARGAVCYRYKDNLMSCVR